MFCISGQTGRKGEISGIRKEKPGISKYSEDELWNLFVRICCYWFIIKKLWAKVPLNPIFAFVLRTHSESTSLHCENELKIPLSTTVTPFTRDHSWVASRRLNQYGAVEIYSSCIQRKKCLPAQNSSISKQKYKKNKFLTLPVILWSRSLKKIPIFGIIFN